ncbi:MAG: hypothetical protein WCK60_00555 [Candidatus Nomurabacteria bacterium]
MKINEIQSTLDQLKERHPKLNEGLISTLLGAGGWDDVSIKEAIALFKSNQETPSLPHQDNISFLELPSLLLSDKNKGEDQIKEKPKESLVASLAANLLNKKVKFKATLPDDLPLKPFDSSPNVWSFSRYKDIFYGNEKEEDTEGEVVVNKSTKKIKEEKEKINKQKMFKIVEVDLEKVPVTTEDEGIIVSIGMFLLIIVLLVIYMYLNGRL